MYTDQEFIEAIKNSYSIAEIHLNLKLSSSGSSYKIIKNKIKLLKINTDHFYEQPLKIKGGRNAKKHWKEILIKKNKGKTTTRKLRRALIESGVEYKCKKCNLGDEWQDETIVLEIDHINENSSDNRQENLQFLCPNCHSQKPIIKNGKKINNCLDCNKEIYKKSIKCRSCTAKKSLKFRKVKNRPPIEQLQKEVSDMGYCATGRKYGVTDNTIRNWIKDYNKQNDAVVEIE